MDQFQQGYYPEEYNQPVDLKEGDYRMTVKDVFFGETKKGDPMLTIDLTIAEATITFSHRLVKNEYFNANLTKFYDCFKIPRGNFNYSAWKGRSGMAHIRKGKPNEQGNAYWEIHYLIVDKAIGQMPQAQAPRPATQPAAPQYQAPAPQRARPDPVDGFVDDFPGF